MAHKIDEFPVFRDAQNFANESILANMDEGFDQESDDGFSKFLYYSKGSVAEVMRRLRRAQAMGFVPPDTVRRLEPEADSICRQIGGLVKYLKVSGFKDRGRFKSSRLRSGMKDQGSRILD